MVRVLLLSALAIALAWFAFRQGGGTAQSGTQRALWVVHYRPGDLGDEPYRDILPHVPAGARLVAAVTNAADADRVRALAPGRTLEVVTVSDRLTPWARDQYVLFRRAGRDVCASRPWYDLPDGKRGDARVPEAIGAITPSLEVLESPITPIGGDVVFAGERVLVGSLSLRYAMERGGLERADALRELERLFGREVVPVPSHSLGVARLHLDLILAWAGRETLLVTDPRLVLPSGDARPLLHPDLGRFLYGRNAALAHGLDEVASLLASRGFTIRRIPGLFSEPREGGARITVLTYTNCVVTDGVVLLPAYGVEPLDGQAADVWRKAGFRVAPVHCARAILGGGAVRCLTNRLPP